MGVGLSFRDEKTGLLIFIEIGYKKGFGNLDKEFWLGLHKIRRLTKESPQTLRFDMSDFEGNSRYAQYQTFDVGNEASGYFHTVASYSGNAGDSFSQHNGQRFTTKDKDQDMWSGHCAQEYKGGWWYYACHYSNLNGIYQVGAN